MAADITDTVATRMREYTRGMLVAAECAGPADDLSEVSETAWAQVMEEHRQRAELLAKALDEHMLKPDELAELAAAERHLLALAERRMEALGGRLRALRAGEAARRSYGTVAVAG